MQTALHNALVQKPVHSVQNSCNNYPFAKIISRITMQKRLQLCIKSVNFEVSIIWQKADNLFLCKLIGLFFCRKSLKIVFPC